MRNDVRRWKYRNTALLVLSLAILVYISDSPTVHEVIAFVGSYGYLGAVVTGVLFVSTFTVAPAAVVLFHIAQDLNPFLVALSAGFGGMIGDVLIFRFLKDGVFEELRPVFWRFGGSHLSALLGTPYFAWLAPVLGAIIIASPFPDEVGIALMGLSNIRLSRFILLVLILDTLGILAIVTLAQSW